MTQLWLNGFLFGPRKVNGEECRLSGLRFQFPPLSPGQMSLRVGKCKLNPTTTSTSQCNFLNEIPIALGPFSPGPLENAPAIRRSCVRKIKEIISSKNIPADCHLAGEQKCRAFMGPTKSKP